MEMLIPFVTSTVLAGAATVLLYQLVRCEKQHLVMAPMVMLLASAAILLSGAEEHTFITYILLSVSQAGFVSMPQIATEFKQVPSTTVLVLLKLVTFGALTFVFSTRTLAAIYAEWLFDFAVAVTLLVQLKPQMDLKVVPDEHMLAYGFFLNAFTDLSKLPKHRAILVTCMTLGALQLGLQLFN